MLDRLVRLRWALCLVAAFEALVVRPPAAWDLQQFAAGGRAVLTGDLASVYASSWMQAGPFELLAAWLMNPSAGGSMRCLAYGAPDVLVRAVAGAVVTGAVMVFVRHLRAVHSLEPSAPAEFAAGAASLVLMLPVRWCAEGHLAQAGVAVAWIWAASLLVRGRSSAAALVIGLAAGWEPWGVLAAGLLLTERRFPFLARAVAVFVTTAVAAYLPFVATGHFELFDLTWPVVRETLWGQLFPEHVQTGWYARVLQGLLAGLAGCALARALGRRAELVWLGPLAVVLARLALDPLILAYYWTAVLVLLVVGAGFARDRWPVAAPVLMVAPFVQLSPAFWTWQNTWYLPAAACLVMFAVVVAQGRRSEVVV
ncbi:hypothetical protein JCM9957A_71080 [Kineosporia succinea]